MSDLSSDGDFDYEDPKPVIMAKRQPRCSESSDDGLEIDCLKDTSDEEPIIVKNKTKKFVPPILASPLAKVTTAKNVKLQKPKRYPNGSPVVLAQPSKSAPSASPLPKSAKPAPAPKANVKCFNMEDNLTATHEAFAAHGHGKPRLCCGETEGGNPVPEGRQVCNCMTKL